MWLILLAFFGYQSTAIAAIPYQCYELGKRVKRAPTIKVTKSERHCRKNEDCTSVVGVCGWCRMAVNHSSHSRLSNRISKGNMVRSCAHGNPPLLTPVCKNGLCGLQSK